MLVRTTHYLKFSIRQISTYAGLHVDTKVNYFKIKIIHNLLQQFFLLIDMHTFGRLLRYLIFEMEFCLQLLIKN